MTRKTKTRLALLGVAAAASVGWPGAVAAGGGGCHRDGPLADGAGDRVAMTRFCMSPSVVRAEPGTEVTFVNDDPVEHNLFGEGWGGFVLPPGGEARHRFASAGTWAYACTLHPGMVGAVVVGDGAPAATATLPDPVLAGRARTTDRFASGAAVGAAAGVAAATAVLYGLAARRRRPASSER